MKFTAVVGMKYVSLFTTCFTILVAVSGCGQSTPSANAPLPNDFVQLSDGRGSASVWGMTIDVEKPVGDVCRSRFDGAFKTDPEARSELTIGDVNIVFKKVPENLITIEINGKQYGNLKTGDAVSIDKERSVKVNGTLRHPEQADTPAILRVWRDVEAEEFCKWLGIEADCYKYEGGWLYCWIEIDVDGSDRRRRALAARDESDRRCRSLQSREAVDLGFTAQDEHDTTFDCRGVAIRRS